MKRERAEEIGLLALAHIAGSEDLARVFFGATGASPDDLRARAGDPGFLASVLEFLTMDDAWIVAFCDASGLGYTQPMAARIVLAGGPEMSWT